jgi:hypothetical protein
MQAAGLATVQQRVQIRLSCCHVDGLLGARALQVPLCSRCSACGASALCHELQLCMPCSRAACTHLYHSTSSSCYAGAATAFTRRQTSLILQNVLVTNCSSAAVVLLGPGASLQATDVTFESNSNAAGVQGLVIAAQQAAVTLRRVVISGNAAARTAPVRNHSKLTYPACKDSSQTGGVTTQPPTDSSSSDAFALALPACGSPMLRSSLLHLQDSSLNAEGTTIRGNTADALITATGSFEQSLQLLAGTQIVSNNVTWLVTADSWPADAVGRANIMAPQPSENTQLLNMQPPFTTRTAMGDIRKMIAKDATAGAAAAGAERVQAFVGLAPKGQVRVTRGSGVTICCVSLQR